MTIVQALILGIVQGLTEFLPISSSGHLVLVPWLAGWTFDPQIAFVFDVLVQLGTLAAVLVYFRRELWLVLTSALRGLRTGRPLDNFHARLGWLLVAASVPASLLGFLLKPQVESAFGSPAAVGAFLLITALLLALSERVGRRVRTMESLTALDALIIGTAQALALFPGVSRSGATISGGLARDLERPEAARFSFLMAVPVMVGAGVVAAVDLARIPDLPANLVAVLVGASAAAIVGFTAIHWLLNYLSHRSLGLFIYYCSMVGTAALIVGLIRA